MKILCAGPTSISNKVLNKMSLSKTNPDLDPDYKLYHREVCKKYSKLLNTNATSFFMLGEAIMTLEGAICSLMEKGERVLVIYNGFFGEGFADYVESYGGCAVKFKTDFRCGIDLESLKAFLKKDSDFSIATLVHCETPSGITNDIKSICTLLNEYGILTIVDSVSAIGGEYIDFDDFKIDVMLGGSQKCLSAPCGLGMVTLSNRAKEKIKNRKTRIPSYYLNFESYYSGENVAPYTFNENLVYALDEALDEVLKKDFIKLHKDYGYMTRETLIKSGFELYPLDSYSNTVTTILTPNGITSEDILKRLRKKDIAISKGVGDMTEKVFRIGHMGNNISYENFILLFEKLDEVFKELNVNVKSSLKENFIQLYEKSLSF